MRAGKQHQVSTAPISGPGSARGLGAAVAAWSALLAALCLLSGCAQPATPAPGSPPRAEVERLLAAVRVVQARPHPGGYDRGCREGEGCVFGPAWSDDYEGTGGHDGCDTRNNVLARQLTDIAFRPGTRDCVVVSGTLADPYTGTRVPFRKSDAQDVPVDHVYPLAAAWDLGAAAWPLDRRVRFANDIDYNLQATTRAANQAKGDSTPGEWLPPSRPGHCFYAAKYLATAIHYDLPITVDDQAALQSIAIGCP
ncbi:HNH endonuclease [Nocardia cyriacigeorgica]|uniref:HNH endonuclease n=1 Tax=Nocardia cyriacigeorgica TaxID=135487 RepID=A0A5R8PAN0_9NOCA|nr:HNH endonuclease family protein [Nocardia cyriacigeorgica]TLG04757.1 HNH endonuclease [Nocardia cyriacigeorgica]